MTTLLLVLLACADPAKDKTAATVTDPPKTPVAAPRAAPAGDLVLHPASGSIGFVGAKVTKVHEGSFGKWSGTMGMTGLDLTAVSLQIEIDSLDVEPEKLATHLKSADFFDAPSFPHATFASTAIKAGAPAGSELVGATHTVEGDMTIRGTTKHLSFPAVIAVTPDSVMARTEFAIQRNDFGIVYPGKPDDLIRDDVVLKVDLITNRANVVGKGPAGATAAPHP